MKLIQAPCTSWHQSTVPAVVAECRADPNVPALTCPDLWTNAVTTHVLTLQRQPMHLLTDSSKPWQGQRFQAYLPAPVPLTAMQTQQGRRHTAVRGQSHLTLLSSYTRRLVRRQGEGSGTARIMGASSQLRFVQFAVLALLQVRLHLADHPIPACI